MEEPLQYVCERYHFKSAKPTSCLNRQKLARLYPSGSFQDCLYCETGATLARENGFTFYAIKPRCTCRQTTANERKTAEALQRMARGCKALGYPDVSSCLHHLYVEKRIGTIEIGKAIGVTAHFLRRVFTDFGIDKRRPGATKGVSRNERRKAIEEIRMLKRDKALSMDQL